MDPVDEEVAEAVRRRWDDVLADLEATAAEYREAGVRAIELHPGDVTPLAGDRFGLDVLIPDDEFEELAAAVEGATFAGADVFRVTTPAVVFLLVALESDDGSLAVLYPAYYGREALRDLRERAGEADAIHTYVRTLDDERGIAFAHDDPGLFLPEGDG